MDGVLLVDKPSGPTSHDVVARVRRVFAERRCGHTGTLDPLATGLLIVCLGRATRLARFLSAAFKSYDATIRFGYATDTYDCTGTPLGEVGDIAPERDALVGALARFEGRQMQRPPAFSAKKRGGKRLYRLAREGTPVEASPVEVEIRGLELESLEGARARIRVTVSSGTYIRSLAHDVGKALGIGAHLEALRRTAIGSFSVTEAVDLETLEARGPGASVLTAEDAMRELPSATVGEETALRLVHGRPPRWEELDRPWEPESVPPVIRVLGPAGELLAIGEPAEAGVRLLVVWARAPGAKTPKS